MTTGNTDIITTGGLPQGHSTGDKIRSIVRDGTPPNTARAYRSDVRYFFVWAKFAGHLPEEAYPVPVEVVMAFIADHLEGLDAEVEERMRATTFKATSGPHAISTIERRVAALSAYHKMRGLASPLSNPAVSQLMSKARKAAARRGYRPEKKVAAVREVVEAMCATCGDDLGGIRDKALILFAWASGGRRRSEVAQASMDRLSRSGAEFTYALGIRKGDQEGADKVVAIAGRAAVALRTWLERSGIEEGPIFRPVDRNGNLIARKASDAQAGICDRTVARVVKSRAKLAGLDPAIFSGHSLRSGFLTESGLRGKNLMEAMYMSDHKTVQTAAGYFQAGSALRNGNARMLDEED